MKHSKKSNNAFALMLGVFLLTAGIWGLYSEVIFGIFSTNTAFAVIHILLGAAGLVCGLRQKAYGYCIFTGMLLTILGLIRFAPGTDELLSRFLNVSETTAYLYIGIGLFTLLVAYAGKPEAPGVRSWKIF